MKNLAVLFVVLVVPECNRQANGSRRGFIFGAKVTGQPHDEGETKNVNVTSDYTATEPSDLAFEPVVTVRIPAKCNLSIVFSARRMNGSGFSSQTLSRFSAHKSGSFVKKIYRNYKIRRQIRQSVNLNYYNFPLFDSWQLVGIVVANEPREEVDKKGKRVGRNEISASVNFADISDTAGH